MFAARERLGRPRCSTRSNAGITHTQASTELLADPSFHKLSRGDLQCNTAHLPAVEVVEKLRSFATDRLGAVIEQRSSGHPKADQEQSDLAAAKALLGRLCQPVS